MADIIEQVRQTLAGHPLVTVGLVFGSIAAGRARPGSDVDVAVAGETPLPSEERRSLIEDLASVTGRPVDLVDLSSTSGLVLREALAHGKLVHCTDRRRYGDLIAKMLFDQADFMPYRQRILAERRQAWTGN